MPIQFSFKEPRHYGNMGKAESVIDILENITGFHSVFRSDRGIHRRPGDNTRITQWDSVNETSFFSQSNEHLQPLRTNQGGVPVLGFSNDATISLEPFLNSKSEFSIATKFYQKAPEINDQDIFGQRTNEPHNWMRYINFSGNTRYRYYYNQNTNFVDFPIEEDGGWRRIIITLGNGSFNFGVDTIDLLRTPFVGDLDFTRFFVGSYGPGSGRSYIDMKTIMFFDYDLTRNSNDIENVFNILDII